MNINELILIWVDILPDERPTLREWIIANGYAEEDLDASTWERIDSLNENETFNSFSCSGDVTMFAFDCIFNFQNRIDALEAVVTNMYFRS